MIAFKQIVAAIALSVVVVISAVAQTDTTDKKNIFSSALNYQTNLHYFGRTDSLQSSGLFPTIGYELKNGLYAQANFIFVQNPSLPLSYTGTTIEAGYKFPQSKNFTGNIFATKFIYKNNSTLVQSALQYQTGINLTYNNSIININAGADAKFSNKTDFGLTAGLDHLFIIKIKDKPMAFAFNPSVYAYFGTQNFSNTYVEKKNVLGVPITQQTTTNTVAFNALSYELSVPIVFVAGKFNASIIPAYVIPQNLIVGEKGKEMFYLTIGMGIRL